MKIFVSICSYRDPHLKLTLESLIQSKSERTDATYAIFEQTKYEDSLEATNPDLVKRPDVIYRRIDPQHSSGVGWARKINSLELTNEDFYYQVDSHMLFDKNWDRSLITDYTLAMDKFNTNKIVISSNCKNFDIIDGIPYLETPQPSSTVAKFYQFANDYKLYVHGEHVEPRTTIELSPHIFAGNLFTHADWLKNVGINQRIFFHGEEQVFTLSSFAAGYKICYGRSIPCYHFIGSNFHTSKQHIEPVVSLEHINKREAESHTELLSFIKSMDDEVLEKFRKQTGVDYINRKIEKRAVSTTFFSPNPNDWDAPDREF